MGLQGRGHPEEKQSGAGAWVDVCKGRACRGFVEYGVQGGLVSAVDLVLSGGPLSLLVWLVLGLGLYVVYEHVVVLSVVPCGVLCQLFV